MSQIIAAERPSDEEKKDQAGLEIQENTADLEQLSTTVVYKLYKRRWFGIVTLVLFNVVCGMNGQFFGPISTSVHDDWGISLTRINWTSNMVNLVYLPATFLTVHITKRIGIKKMILLGGLELLLANWIRAAAISPSLSSDGKFAILMVGQIFVGLAQGCCQIITVRYSELWFDVRGRVVATMLTNISNPLGGAVGSLVLPQAASVNWAILIGAIIATVIFPFGFILQEQPPTPPTFAGSTKSPGMTSLFRALVGKEPVDSTQYMDLRDRVDFALLFLVFGVICAATSTWSNFGNQIYGPYGYTQGRVGLFDATILLAGIVAALVGAPVIGRMFGRNLQWAVRTFLPIISACWIAQIWNVKPHNDGAIFAVMVIIGICSFLLLPVGLELGAEVTRNAEASCGLLWFNVNLIAFIWILVEDALRAGPDGNPPLNMTRALIFNGSTIAATALVFIIGFRGQQKRREKDIAKYQEAAEEETHTESNNAQPFPPEKKQ